jgi:hypothetical protein
MVDGKMLPAWPGKTAKVAGALAVRSHTWVIAVTLKCLTPGRRAKPGNQPAITLVIGFGSSMRIAAIGAHYASRWPTATPP